MSMIDEERYKTDDSYRQGVNDAIGVKPGQQPGKLWPCTCGSDVWVNATMAIDYDAAFRCTSCNKLIGVPKALVLSTNPILIDLAPYLKFPKGFDIVAGQIRGVK